jgi:general nucleoside transport system permease protein
MRQLHRAGRERIWLSLALCLLAATVVLLIVVAGANPLLAMKGLLDGAFGDRYAIAETLVQSVPIAIVALGVAPA